MTTQDIVTTLGSAIAERIGPQRYQLWFQGNTRFSWDGRLLTIGVPNRFFQEWLESTFLSTIEDAVRQVAGMSAAIRFEINAALFQASRERQSAVEKQPAPIARPPTPLPPPRPLSRMSEFQVGPNNRLAHAAAVQFTEWDSPGPTLLTLHGPPGVGKTHLLEAILAETQRKYRDLSAVLVTAEEFTNRFLSGMHARQLGRFRKQFRDAWLLLIDDFHFFADKEATQQEFLHTLDALQRQGRRVAVACDCHPRLLRGILPEIVNRLLGGGVWELALPPAETRRAIVQAKAKQIGADIPDDVCRLLADEVPGTIRELEGSLHSVLHFSRVHRQPVTVDLARQALGKTRPPGRGVGLEDIERAVCRVADLDPRTLHRKSRCRAVSHPRMIVIYLARQLTTASLTEISRYFGCRNHTTALAAEKRVRQWCESDHAIVLGSRTWSTRELLAEVRKQLPVE